jgi:outer membrane biosynthesis protein TonB
LKYLVGAGVIVVLVILIVMVTLRMDSRKVPDTEPVSSTTSEPAPAEQAKPVADETAKPEQVSEEKNIQNIRASGKHGSNKPARHVDVGPSPEHQPVAKQPAKPALPARPNPFDESKVEPKGPTVSQSQISAVVRSKVNQAGLKACYERALKMDNHLTSGRIDVTVSIGLSGMVQRVVINAPSSFIMVEPCIKTAVKRWVFPPSSEEYATNFPLIMQGGM